MHILTAVFVTVMAIILVTVILRGTFDSDFCSDFLDDLIQGDLLMIIVCFTIITFLTSHKLNKNVSPAQLHSQRKAM